MAAEQDDWQKTLNDQTYQASVDALAEDEPDLSGLPESNLGSDYEQARPDGPADVGVGPGDMIDSLHMSDLDELEGGGTGSGLGVDDGGAVAAAASDVQFEPEGGAPPPVVPSAQADEDAALSATEEPIQFETEVSLDAPETDLSAPPREGSQHTMDPGEPREGSEPIEVRPGEEGYEWENTRNPMTMFSEGTTPTPDDAYNQFLTAYKKYLAGG